MTSLSPKSGGRWRKELQWHEKQPLSADSVGSAHSSAGREDAPVALGCRNETDVVWARKARDDATPPRTKDMSTHTCRRRALCPSHAQPALLSTLDSSAARMVSKKKASNPLDAHRE